MSTEDYLLGTSIEGVLDRHTHTHTHAQSLSLSILPASILSTVCAPKQTRTHEKNIASKSNFISADSMTVESLEMRRVDILRKREGERESKRASEEGREVGRENLRDRQREVLCCLVSKT